MLCKPPPVAFVTAAVLRQAGGEAGRKECQLLEGRASTRLALRGQALRAVDRTAALCVSITLHSGRGSERVLGGRIIGGEMW